MPATVRQKLAEFRWDAARLRYRRKGRFVTTRAVKLAVRRVIRDSQADMVDVTEQLTRGELSVAEWQSRFAAELKNLHVAGAMAGQGGPASMTRADYLRAGRELKRQYRHLDRFARGVAAGELEPSAIRRRAAMYVNSMNPAYEGGRQAAAILAGYTHERNVLGDRRDHCRTGARDGCLDLTKRKWVPIGTMPLPGHRTCLSACGCELRFRKGEPLF